MHARTRRAPGERIPRRTESPSLPPAEGASCGGRRECPRPHTWALPRPLDAQKSRASAAGASRRTRRRGADRRRSVRRDNESYAIAAVLIWRTNFPQFKKKISEVAQESAIILPLRQEFNIRFSCRFSEPSHFSFRVYSSLTEQDDARDEDCQAWRWARASSPESLRHGEN